MKSKIIAVIMVLTAPCVYIALGRLADRNYFFLPESDHSADENDADAETFWANVSASYFKTSELTIEGVLQKSVLTGKQVSILIPNFYREWGVLWYKKPAPAPFFYALETNETIQMSEDHDGTLLLGLHFRPSESLFGHRIKASGTLTYQRLQVTDFFHENRYVLYVEDFETLSP